MLDHPVELRDIMPTLLEAAGMDAPPSVDGRSLLAAARGTSIVISAEGMDEAAAVEALARLGESGLGEATWKG